MFMVMMVNLAPVCWGTSAEAIPGDSTPSIAPENNTNNTLRDRDMFVMIDNFSPF
jgi:hypothetical protein